ncbi:MAG: PEP-CTERM sorting domain-containing protein [Thermoguttaceae bacterium]
MKKTTFLTMIFVFVAALSQIAYSADSEQINYRETNLDNSTLKINDTAGPNSLYGLFNKYFGLDKNNGGYANSNDLYFSRGYTGETGTWTTTGNAMLYAGFKGANFYHTISLADADGNVISDILFDNRGFSNGILTDMAPVELNTTDSFQWKMDVYYGENGEKPAYSLFSDSDMNGGGLINMIVLDVTDLMQEKYIDQKIESAYMFGWEDKRYSDYVYNDFDYQDFSYILVNVAPESSITDVTSTPEPATLTIFGIAGLAGAFVYRRKIK